MLKTTQVNVALKIPFKPLDMATWLLFTVYRNLSSPNATIPSPTSYDIPFSQNTCVTDRQTDTAFYYRRDRRPKYSRPK